MKQDSKATIERLYEELGFLSSDNLITVQNVSLDNYPQKLIFEAAKNKLGVDSVFFYEPPGSNANIPYIYFSRLEGYNPAEVSEQLANLHKLAWNMARAPVLFVALPNGQVLIYDTYHPPTEPQSNRVYKTGLITILNIFSTAEKQRREAFHRREFESGRFWKQHQKRFNPKKRSDQTLLNNLKVMRQELVSLFRKDGISLEIASELTHSLLGRSIFIKYLEDRLDSFDNNVFPDDFFARFYNNATCFADVLVDEKATYELFDFLNKKFNGDLFPVENTEREHTNKKHLEMLQLFLTGKAEMISRQLGLWKFYSFEVIPIEFISSIYEEFFYIREKEQSGKKLTKSGTHYTPHYLVEFLVDEVFPWQGNRTDVKTLDPACGSGIFLVEIYRRLIAHWQQANPGQLITHQHLEMLLTENIFGVDLNGEAVRVAAFSLYLTFCDFLEPRYIWEHVKFPNLKYKNLFPTDFFEEKNSFAQSYDLIVGNPPWQSELTPAAEEYRNRIVEDFPTRQVAPDNQIALAFLWRSAELCKSNGEVCLLLPSKGLLFNRSNTHRNFRQEFFSTFYIKTIINFSASRHILFEKATGPGAAIFFSPSPPNDNESILYCSPKPTHSLEDKWQITIEPQDINLLPRAEAIENDIVWKAAMWGGPRDYELIKKLMAPPYQSLAQVCDQRGWVHGEGVTVGNKKNDATRFLGKPYVDARKLERFVVNEKKLPSFNEPNLENLRKKTSAIFRGPHIVLKQSVKAGEKGIRAALLKKEAIFKHSLMGIYSFNSEDTNTLIKYCLFLNTRIPVFVAMMTSRRWLVERDELEKDEIMAFPMPFIINDVPVSHEYLQKLATNKDWEEKLKKEIEPLYDLNEDELILIDDAINYTLDYFRQKKKSMAAFPTYDDVVVEGERILTEYVIVAQKTLQNSFGQQFIPIIFQSEASSLRVVALQLNEDTANPDLIIEESQQALDLALATVDEYLREQRSPNLFIQRNLRAYVGKTIYIIKPDQRRYWTKSMALRDADEIYIDIMDAWS